MYYSALARVTLDDLQDDPALGPVDLSAEVDRYADVVEDRVLFDAVGRALRSTGYPALRDIEIDICQGGVELRGRVPSYHQKQLAQAMVQRVEGVRGINNGIEVSSCR